MNAATGQFSYEGQHLAAVHPNVYTHQCVDPRQLLRNPEVSHSSERPLEQSVPHHVHMDTVDHVGIGIHVNATYNAGDRLFNGHNTPQDQERNWALLQPVQQYNRTHRVAALDGANQSNYMSNYFVAAEDTKEAPPQCTQDDFTNTVEPSFGSFNFAATPASTPLPSQSLTPEPEPASTQHLPTSPLATHNHSFICPTCGPTRCKTLDSFKRHQAREHGTKAVLYFCPEHGCPYDTKKESDIERHMDSVHRKRQRFRCPLCARTFPRKDNCRRHIKDKEHRPDLAVVVVGCEA